jgi:hypothetical protein
LEKRGSAVVISAEAERDTDMHGDIDALRWSDPTFIHLRNNLWDAFADRTGLGKFDGYVANSTIPFYWPTEMQKLTASQNSDRVHLRGAIRSDMLRAWLPELGGTLGAYQILDATTLEEVNIRSDELYAIIDKAAARVRDTGRHTDLIILVETIAELLVWQYVIRLFYSCFISYASPDFALATRLHGDLERRGVQCWLATEDLKIGNKIRPTIDEAIRNSERLLLILSEASIRSEWVEFEVESAMEKEQISRKTMLFPIMADRSVLISETAWAAGIRRTRHIGDFCDWQTRQEYDLAFAKLLRDLSKA